jgi:acetyl-CoA synthetase
VLKPDVIPNDMLRQELRQMVIAEMGKSLAPKSILFVSDLPKTRNAKVMRRMIRSAYLGQEPGDTSSLVNPQAVDEIRKAK